MGNTDPTFANPEATILTREFERPIPLSIAPACELLLLLPWLNMVARLAVYTYMNAFEYLIMNWEILPRITVWFFWAI